MPPLTVMWGERNHVLPAAAGRELADRLAPAGRWFAPGAGHMVMRERADQVNQRIAAIAAG